MTKRKLQLKTPFLAASRSSAEGGFVLFGAPFEGTVSHKAGTKLGPAAIREESQGLEEFSLELGRDLRETGFGDLGDLVFDQETVEEVLDEVYFLSREVLGGGRRPFLLGGEHLVSLGPIRAVAEAYPDLVLVHFDAHADTRDDYLGEKLSHATVIRRAADFVDPSRIYQFAIRSGEASETEWSRRNVNFFPGEDWKRCFEVFESLKGAPVYLTLDIDVVDPAFAPGTGTPEPEGLTSREVLSAARAAGRLNLMGVDLVEVSPPHDPSGITAALAAKLVRETILSSQGGS